MKRETAVVWMRSRNPLFWAVVLVCAMVCMPVQAQTGGRPGQELSGAEAEAAWALEARHVAGKLQLSMEGTEQLVKAFQEARKNLAAAIEAKMEKVVEGVEDRGARRAAIRKLREETGAAEREKFKKAISAFLNEEQAQKAVDLLGSFSTRWDAMVHILAGFELGQKQDDALELVNAYIVEQTKVWQTVTGEDRDFSQLREKLTDMKTALDKALEAILSEKQLAEWKTATTYRGGQRGERGRSEQSGGSDRQE